MNIIAIDLGTTHCKAVIINTKGKVLKTFQLAAKPIQSKPGWNEQNADEIFNAVIKLLQQSFSFCEEKDIACVSFSALRFNLINSDIELILQLKHYLHYLSIYQFYVSVGK